MTNWVSGLGPDWDKHQEAATLWWWPAAGVPASQLLQELRACSPQHQPPGLPREHGHEVLRPAPYQPICHCPVATVVLHAHGRQAKGRMGTEGVVELGNHKGRDDCQHQVGVGAGGRQYCNVTTTTTTAPPQPLPLPPPPPPPPPALGDSTSPGLGLCYGPWFHIANNRLPACCCTQHAPKCVCVLHGGGRGLVGTIQGFYRGLVGTIQGFYRGLVGTIQGF